MKNLLAICSIIIFLIACEKDNLPNYSANLIGKWSWISSCPGMANPGPVCWFPGSTYPDYTISFDTKWNYCVFQNDILKSLDKFQTTELLADNGKDMVHIIKFKSGHINMYSISNDTLHMTNSEGIVTITSHYKRIK